MSCNCVRVFWLSRLVDGKDRTVAALSVIKGLELRFEFAGRGDVCSLAEDEHIVVRELSSATLCCTDDGKVPAGLCGKVGWFLS